MLHCTLKFTVISVRTKIALTTCQLFHHHYTICSQKTNENLHDNDIPLARVQAFTWEPSLVPQTKIRRSWRRALVSPKLLNYEKGQYKKLIAITT